MASQPKSAYVYDELPVTQCFRLLRILNCTPAEDFKLVCRLDIYELEACPEYQALSYVWGPPFEAPECAAEYGPDSDVAIILENFHNSDSTRGTNGEDQYKSVEPARSRFHIQRNLYEALLRLRNGGYSGHLWADAVCINQQDLDERKHQVGLMGKIYSRASEVICWLGECVTATDHLDYMHGPFATVLIQYHNEHHSCPVKCIADRDNSSVMVEELGMCVSIDELLSLFSFYMRVRWFKRAWIFQEYCLARSRCIVYGAHQTDALSLMFVAWFMNARQTFWGTTKLYLMQHNLQHGHQLAFPFGLMQLNWVGRYRGKGALSNNDSKMFRSVYGAVDDVTLRFAHMELFLETTSQQLASDPRDVIYAILGLVGADMSSTSESLIAPDYTKTVEDVFTNFTSKCLRTLPHLTILSLNFYPLSGTDVTRLPSWVPDYRNRIVCPPILQRLHADDRDYKAFSACGRDIDARPLLHLNGSLLSLRGMCCGKISDCSARGTTVEESNLADAKSFEAQFVASLLRICCRCNRGYKNGVLGQTPMDAAALLVNLGYYMGGDSPTAQRLLRAWVTWMLVDGWLDVVQDEAAQQMRERTLACIDAIADPQSLPVQDEIVSLMQEIETQKSYVGEGRSRPAYSPELDALCEDCVAFATNLIRVVSGRRLFGTADGLMGWCASRAEPDDEVWLLMGAKVPFVLRQADQAGHYTLQGECYVQGGMYGELISSGFAGEETQITLV